MYSPVTDVSVVSPTETFTEDEVLGRLLAREGPFHRLLGEHPDVVPLSAVDGAYDRHGAEPRVRECCMPAGCPCGPTRRAVRRRSTYKTGMGETTRRSALVVFLELEP
ncbi:hypothetical protein [Streptomyces formicae]|uniref:Uncharacterized protein n=1 Tax=Streptomyces formicae TaxID=1616117 RepID=A0ABY3WK81_9ACTN|nr:hypothetical protein [Streptomyces formicae]UNM11000.1 hypothetical protein J4032_05245 [Streptomyces formicae]